MGPRLVLEAASPFVNPGGQVNLHWAIENAEALPTTPALELVIVAPLGLTAKGQKAELFDATTGQFHLPLPQSSPEETTTPEASATVDITLEPSQVPVSSLEAGGIPTATQATTAGWQGVIQWELAADTPGPYTFQAQVIQLGEPPSLLLASDLILYEENVFRVPAAGGEGRAQGGRVRVVVPQESIDRALTFRVRPAGVLGELPNSLSGGPIEIVAETEETLKPYSRFLGPFTVELHYSETDFVGYERSLTVFWYDSASSSWRPLPTLVDAEANVLRAQTDHLSVFDFSTQDWEAARLPSVAAFQVAPFAGAATYSMDLEVPPGPGGLQPSLTLAYNSQVVDAANNRTQASWVGMGWSLDTGYIQRNMNGSLDFNGDDTFTLVVAGVSSMLLPIPDQDGDATTDDYKLTDDTFWRIRRYNATVVDGYLTDISYWVVWDKQGNKYTFQPGPFYPEYVDCWAPILQRWEWPLTTVENVFGKQLTYTYSYEMKTSRNNCDSQYQSYHAVAVYPDTITYPNGRYRVTFQRAADRTDYDVAWAGDYQAYTLFQRSRLSEVRVEHDSDGDGTFEQLIRKYVFTYENDPAERVFPNVSWPAGGRTLTLSQVQEFGLGGATSLPPITFTYGDNMHLTRADNGYGGRVEFVYERWAADAGVDAGSGAGCSPPCGLYQSEISFPALQKPLFYPGGTCHFAASVNGYVGTTVAFGLNDGTTTSWSAPIPVQHTSDWGWEGYEATLVLSATASTALPYFRCDWCSIGAVFQMNLYPTRYRVTEKRIYDGVDPGANTFTYAYTGAAMNDAAHSAGVSTSDPLAPAMTEFRGHATTAETGPDGRQVTTWFFQDDILKGRSYKIETREGGGALLTEAATAYDYTQQTAASTPLFPHKQNGYTIFTDLVIYWIRQSSRTDKTYEGEASWDGTLQEFSYEIGDQSGSQYGNLTRVVESAWTGSAWQAYRGTHTAYFPNSDANINLVGLPGLQERFACPGGSCQSTPAAQTLYLYDRSTSYTAPPTVGKLTAIRTLVYSPGGSPRYRDETYDYDAWGNRTGVTVYTGYGTSSTMASVGPQASSTAFDDVYHTYALSVTNALTQTISWTYDYALGLPVTETDPNNATTSADYDDFGRLTWIRRPGDESGPPSVAVTYYDSQQPFQVVITQRLDASTTQTYRRFYNGIGLLIQTQTANAELAEGTRDVVVDSWYDAHGRLTRQSVPYGVTPGSAYRTPDTGQASTSTDYDVLGRPLVLTATDGTETRYSYNRLEAVVTDAETHITRTLNDVWGRTTEVIPATGPSAQYSYDMLDRLVQVSMGGATTTMVYDNAGRKSSIDDADMGDWSYGYDALGNLLTQTDARGCTTTLGYDELNRLTSKTYTGPGLCGSTPAVGYTFDQGAYGIGHRTGMTDGSGSSAWTYDIRGRMIEERKTISGAGIFVTAWGYNSADQIDWMTYPGGNAGQSGEQVDYNYHPQGSLDSVSSGLGTYVQQSSYDAAGRLTDRRLGNDVVRQGFDYYPWTTAGGQGRLSQITAGVPSAPSSLMELDFDYDLVGNITAIDDWRTEGWQTQTYAYDSLNRLTAATVTGFGEGLYAETYSYSPTTGNLASFAGVDYGYETTHPHAVTQLEGSDRFSYDANGNLTERNAEQTAFTLDYDAEGHLVSVTSQSLAPTATPPPAGTLLELSPVADAWIEGIPGAMVPLGTIVLFAGSCPSGWERYSPLDGYFSMGSSTGGQTGGSAQHQHAYNDIPQHTHGAGSVTTTTDGAHTHSLHYSNGSGGSFPYISSLTWTYVWRSDAVDAAGDHTHTVSGDTAPTGVASPLTQAAAIQPPYLEVVYCQKTSPSSAGLPPGAIILFDSGLPVAWDRFTALDDRFPLGAPAYGATGWLRNPYPRLQ